MPYTHYLIPADRRFWCPSPLIWAVSRLYGHIGGMEVRFYAAKNAKNCLLGFAGQRPYITPSLAVRGPFCTPGVLFGVARPSKPRRKGGRRISGHPAGYPRGTVGTGGECWLGLRHPSPAPPAAENGLWIPRGGCHGILKGWGALGPDIEKVALGDGSSLSQKAPQSTELTAQWLKLQGERKGNAS